MLAWAVEEVQRRGAAAMLANVGPVMRCRVFAFGQENQSKLQHYNT